METGKPFLEGDENNYVNATLHEQTGVAWLWRIQVEQGNRGTGLAGVLLQKLVAEAKQRNLKSVQGIFEPDEGCEERARAFYLKHGFSFETHEGKRYLDGSASEYEVITLLLEP